MKKTGMFFSALALGIMMIFCFAAAEEQKPQTDVTVVAHHVPSGGYVQFSGSIRQDDGFERVCTYIRNEYEPGTEAVVTREFDHDVTEFDMDELNRDLRRKYLVSGERSVTVTVTHNGIETPVYSTECYVLGKYRTGIGVTAECTILSPSNTGNIFRDGVLSSYMSMNGKEVYMKIPETVGKCVLVLEWRRNADNVLVEMYDGNERKTGEKVLTDRFYADCLELDETVRYVRVSAPKNCPAELTEMLVYRQGEVPSSIPFWEKPKEDLDILFVSTHQDDEFLFFGGAIPYYAAKGNNIAVLYTVGCGASRYAEALDALWVSGVKAHPIFLGYKDGKFDSVRQMEREWAQNGDALTDLVTAIRKYRPKVIVTQDEKGEYGHIQHIYTVSLVEKAVKLAADETQYPESAALYGAWQVQKLYSHLYTQNRIFMDWTQPLEGRKGISAIELATVAYDRNFSQHQAYQMERHGVRYDNTCFGLVASTVGEDVEKNDFLENVR